MKKKLKVALAVIFTGCFVCSYNASATVFSFDDTWVNWNGETTGQYADRHTLGDENGTPKLYSMDVTLVDGYLTQVDLFLHTSTKYQNYNSLFLNTSWDGEDSTFDAWDFLVHDGGVNHKDTTKGKIAKDGLYTVEDDYKYTYVKKKNRIGNPNGIVAGDLSDRHKKFGADFTDLHGSDPVTAMLSYNFSGLDYLNDGKGLAVDGGFFVAYSPWCANDVIGGGATTAPVPEPATMLLFGTGLAGLAAVSKRRKKK